MALRPTSRDATALHRPRLLVTVAFLASLLQLSSAFGLSAVSQARLLDRPRSEKLSELSKEQWLGLLRGAELHGAGTSALIPNRTLPGLAPPDDFAHALLLLPDDVASDLSGNASSAAGVALLQSDAITNLHSNGSEAAQLSGGDLDDNSSALDASGEDVLDEVRLRLLSSVSDLNGTSSASLREASNETSAVALANWSASPVAGKDLSLHNLSLHNRSSSSSAGARAGEVAAVRQLRIGTLLAVATATSAKSHPSGAAAAQLRPLRPLGSRTLRPLQGAHPVPVRSVASAGGLGRALEGGDGRGSMSSVLRIVIGIFVAAVIMLFAVIMFDRAGKPPPESTDANAQMRQWVRSLPLCSGDEVKRIFRERSGYDCLLMQPQAAPCAVRLQGSVAALAQNVLKAPLARSNCVLFTTSASMGRLDGVRAPPTAFYAMNSDFDLELDGTSPGSTEIRIRLRGRDVALFDVASGWRLERTILKDAPEHLQDFLHVHRAPGVEFPEAHEVLDFTECLLSVGARVTCVGELRRAPTGELQLWPLQNSDDLPSATNGVSVETVYNSPQGLLSGLTSWERVGSPAQPCRSPRMGKVMISDDPRLLGHPASTMFSSLLRRTRGLFHTSL